MIVTRPPLSRQRVCAFLVVAVLASASPANADKFSDLAGQLKSDNYKIRLGAALALGRLAEVRSVGPLTQALGDSNQTVRGVAAAALAKAAAKAGVAPADLKNAVVRLCTSSKNDASDFVKTQAAKTLAAIVAFHGAKTPPNPCSQGGGGAGGTQPTGGARWIIALKVSDATKSAKPEEMTYLTNELAKQIKKDSTFAAGEFKSMSVGKGQTGWEYSVALKKLSVTPAKGYVTVECKTEGFIATFPGGSVVTTGTLPMEAALQSSNNEKEIALAKKDCLGAIADVLKDTMYKFAKSRQ